MGLNEMWLLGDNFMSTTYRVCYKKSTSEFYTKENYEITAFCSSKYADKNTNALSRLQIALANTLNKKIYLPQYVVVILDDDLIQYLKYKKFGVSTMYGTWIEWLANEFNTLVDTRRQQLPLKSKKEGRTEPQFYWMSLPAHRDFDEEETSMRTKFNLCMESVVKTFDNMRVIKPKAFWDRDDSDLMFNGTTLSSYGNKQYWLAIDSALKFNIEKRKEFLIKEAARSVFGKCSGKKNTNPIQGKVDHDDPVRRFFKKKRNRSWSREQDQKKLKTDTGNRFILPRPNKTR